MSHDHRVLTIGETMGLAVNDTPGTLASSRAHTVSFGGAESNVAVALSRLGVATTWLSRLGKDPLGELIRRELQAEGVEVHADADATRPTGFMHKHRRTSDTATVTFWRAGSAASALTSADVPQATLQSARLLHLTGILPGLSDATRAATLAIARRARAAGLIVSFDINHRAKVWADRDARVTYLDIIRLSDIVFAGDEEAALVVDGATPAELARNLTALGPSQVIVKLGADGAFARVNGIEYDQDPVQVNAVDSVGAGDAFVAAYLSALLEELPAKARLERAAAAGAFACLVLGDWEGAPTLAELASLKAREGIVR